MRGDGKKDDRLQRAALIHLKLGSIREYCELMCQAGHWEKALSVAPAVSMVYWQELCKKYCSTQFKGVVVDEIAPFLAACGEAPQLIQNYIDKNELESAFLVANSWCSGKLHPSISITKAFEESNIVRSGTAELEKVAARIANRYMAIASEPLLAAETYLAVSDPQSALIELIRGHEIFLAFVICKCLGLQLPQPLRDSLTSILEHNGCWAESLNVFRQSSDEDKERQITLFNLRQANANKSYLTTGNIRGPVANKDTISSPLKYVDCVEAVLRSCASNDVQQACLLATTVSQSMLSS